MTEKRKYPIVGTDFFTQIMDDDGYYIDKTDVIPWILARKKRVVLFTRPRRFGKSTMMSMLKAFFEYRLDCYGKPVDNRHYFENLMVSQDAGILFFTSISIIRTIRLKEPWKIYWIAISVSGKRFMEETAAARRRIDSRLC